MTKFFLCTADQIEPDRVIRVDLPDRAPLAVYNLDGAFYATENTCTHGEASLAEGEIVDGQIVCPFHGGTFDIKSGEATCSPCIIPLKTHEVRTEGNALYVELE